MRFQEAGQGVVERGPVDPLREHAVEMMQKNVTVSAIIIKRNELMADLNFYLIR
jgi:hypothetical protein